ncbi:MAG: hypothetical protein R2824_28885, partial [Saprospiraceae bacterium]
PVRNNLVITTNPYLKDVIFLAFPSPHSKRDCKDTPSQDSDKIFNGKKLKNCHRLCFNFSGLFSFAQRLSLKADAKV